MLSWFRSICRPFAVQFRGEIAPQEWLFLQRNKKNLPEERFRSKVCAVVKLYIFSVIWQAVIPCLLHSCGTPGSQFAWRIICWNLLLGHLHQGSGMTQKKNTRSWYWSGANSNQNCTSFHCYTSGFGSDPSVRKLRAWNKTSMIMWIPFCRLLQAEDNSFEK